MQTLILLGSIKTTYWRFHDMTDVEHEFANSLASGIVDVIDELIMMMNKGYELNVETWIDPTLEYSQQRKWKYVWSKTND